MDAVPPKHATPKYTRASLPTDPTLQKRGPDYYLGAKKVIPAEDVAEFLKNYYDDPSTGMRGRDAMFARISENYVGISRRTIAAFLSNHETAQVHKAVSTQPVTRPAVLKKEGQLAVDLTWLKRTDPAESDLKDSQILFTCIDVFSKFAWVRILPNKTGPTVAKAMQSVVDDIKKSGGVMPTAVRSDNGSEFKAKEFGAVVLGAGARQIFSDVYNPRQNGVVERFNKTLKMMIYKMMTQHNLGKITDSDLQKIVDNYNSTRHGTTGTTPAEVHGGDEDAAELTHLNMRERAKKLVVENETHYPPLAVGDHVRVARRTEGSWRKTRQLKKMAYMKLWTYEVFTIAAKTRGSKTKAVTYTLKDEHGEIIMATSGDYPRQFIRQDLQKIDPNQLVRELEPGEYVVDRVLDKKVVRGKVKYLVSWRGHDDQTWQSPEPSFQSAIDDYEAKQSV